MNNKLKKIMISSSIPNYNVIGSDMNEIRESHNSNSTLPKKGKIRYIESNQNKAPYIVKQKESTDHDIKQTIHREELGQKHQKIVNSLKYASRIQRALIPTDRDLFSLSKKSFALYLPKDIVSGDFYMAEKIERASIGTVQVYVVADCTGHGVPGAMLSVLCSSILKEAIRDRKINEPSEALNFAKNKLLTTLNDDNSEREMYDGMDVSMCAILPQEKLIQFSGANLPLYLMSEGKLRVIKGDRQSIGFSRLCKPFKTHLIKYKKGDSIYMFSDGIVDQFGGERDKKFLSKRLKKLLYSVQENPIPQQKAIIKKTIMQWKGQYEQTDDMCMIGRKL